MKGTATITPRGTEILVISTQRLWQLALADWYFLIFVSVHAVLMVVTGNPLGSHFESGTTVDVKLSLIWPDFIWFRFSAKQSWLYCFPDIMFQFKIREDSSDFSIKVLFKERVLSLWHFWGLLHVFPVVIIVLCACFYFNIFMLEAQNLHWLVIYVSSPPWIMIHVCLFEHTGLCCYLSS